uniref:Uncharacterized protein LOC114348675 n=1 Tax=Diabrotica virgifera virgifera TaxID=50390 RepID=A0A6P7H8R4_DIAVI
MHILITIFNLVGEDCKKRWRSIRDTWKCLKREGKFKTGSAVPKKRKLWHLTPYLGFLDNVSEERTTMGNLGEEPNAEYVEEEEQQIIEESGTSTSGKTIIEESETSGTSAPSSAGDRAIAGTSGTSTPSGSVLKTPSRKAMMGLLQSSKNERQILLEAISTTQKKDDIDHFFDSIAISIKELPRHAQTKAKMRTLVMLQELQEECAAEEIIYIQSEDL